MSLHPLKLPAYARECKVFVRSIVGCRSGMFGEMESIKFSVSLLIELNPLINSHILSKAQNEVFSRQLSRLVALRNSCLIRGSIYKKLLINPLIPILPPLMKPKPFVWFFLYLLLYGV